MKISTASMGTDVSGIELTAISVDQAPANTRIPQHDHRIRSTCGQTLQFGGGLVDGGVDRSNGSAGS